MHNKAEDRALAELYNLPSARTKIRKIKTARDKRILAAYREQIHVMKLIFQLGYEDLVPPIQRGFKRTFVLRYDAANNANKQFYQEILDVVNTVQYCPRKDFKVKKRRRGLNRYKLREQHLAKLTVREFNKAKLTDKQRELFIQWEAPKTMVTYYRFKEEWRFVLKVSPNMITKVRILDLELENRYQAAIRYLEQDSIRYRLAKLKGRHVIAYWHYDCGDEKDKYKHNPIKGKTIQTIEQEFREEIRHLEELKFNEQ